MLLITCILFCVTYVGQTSVIRGRSRDVPRRSDVIHEWSEHVSCGSRWLDSEYGVTAIEPDCSSSGPDSPIMRRFIGMTYNV